MGNELSKRQLVAPPEPFDVEAAISYPTQSPLNSHGGLLSNVNVPFKDFAAHVALVKEYQNRISGNLNNGRETSKLTGRSSSGHNNDPLIKILTPEIVLTEGNSPIEIEPSNSSEASSSLHKIDKNTSRYVKKVRSHGTNVSGSRSSPSVVERKKRPYPVPPFTSPMTSGGDKVAKRSRVGSTDFPVDFSPTDDGLTRCYQQLSATIKQLMENDKQEAQVENEIMKALELLARKIISDDTE